MTTTKQFIAALFVVISSVLAVGATTMFAQSIETKIGESQETGPALYAYKVEHDHRIGKSGGELLITERGFEYRGASKDEAKHNQIWRDDDIKRLEIRLREIRIIAYEASRYPLIPRQAPFSKGGKDLRLGSEREHVFKLIEGEITPEVVSKLLARFKRPVMTSVMPKEDDELSKLLFEISVFHRHRKGGAHGMLRVYEQHVIFVAEVQGQSRFWRYSDIRDIGRLGRYGFEIATYEKQFAADGKSYIFDLKRPMTDAEYEKLWARVYEREQSPRLQSMLYLTTFRV
jgi:hypothetical protein